jgi:hypothetical protein
MFMFALLYGSLKNSELEVIFMEEFQVHYLTVLYFLAETLKTFKRDVKHISELDFDHEDRNVGKKQILKFMNEGLDHNTMYFRGIYELIDKMD